jgi:hypothetical protein
MRRFRAFDLYGFQLPHFTMDHRVKPGGDDVERLRRAG